MIYSIDGNQVCAVDHGFKCLSTDHAGFGDSLKEAFLGYWRTLIKGQKSIPDLRDLMKWEIAWVNEI